MFDRRQEQPCCGRFARRSSTLQAPRCQTVLKTSRSSSGHSHGSIQSHGSKRSFRGIPDVSKSAFWSVTGNKGSPDTLLSESSTPSTCQCAGDSFSVQPENVDAKQTCNVQYCRAMVNMLDVAHREKEDMDSASYDTGSTTNSQDVLVGSTSPEWEISGYFSSPIHDVTVGRPSSVFDIDWDAKSYCKCPVQGRWPLQYANQMGFNYRDWNTRRNNCNENQRQPQQQRTTINTERRTIPLAQNYGAPECTKNEPKDFVCDDYYRSRATYDDPCNVENSRVLHSTTEHTATGCHGCTTAVCDKSYPVPAHHSYTKTQPCQRTDDKKNHYTVVNERNNMDWGNNTFVSSTSCSHADVRNTSPAYSCCSRRASGHSAPLSSPCCTPMDSDHCTCGQCHCSTCQSNCYYEECKDQQTRHVHLRGDSDIVGQETIRQYSEDQKVDNGYPKKTRAPRRSKNNPKSQVLNIQYCKDQKQEAFSCFEPEVCCQTETKTQLDKDLYPMSNKYCDGQKTSQSNQRNTYALNETENLYYENEQLGREPKALDNESKTKGLKAERKKIQKTGLMERNAYLNKTPYPLPSPKLKRKAHHTTTMNQPNIYGSSSRPSLSLNSPSQNDEQIPNYCGVNYSFIQNQPSQKSPDQRPSTRVQTNSRSSHTFRQRKRAEAHASGRTAYPQPFQRQDGPRPTTSYAPNGLNVSEQESLHSMKTQDSPANSFVEGDYQPPPPKQRKKSRRYKQGTSIFGQCISYFKGIFTNNEDDMEPANATPRPKKVARRKTPPPPPSPVRKKRKLRK